MPVHDLPGVLGHSFSLGPWDNRDAVSIGHDDVAGNDQNIAANDGPVDGFQLVPPRPDASPNAPQAERDFLGDDLVRVAGRPARDHPDAAEALPFQDVAGADRADVRVRSFLDDEGRARPAR